MRSTIEKRAFRRFLAVLGPMAALNTQPLWFQRGLFIETIQRRSRGTDRGETIRGTGTGQDECPVYQPRRRLMVRVKLRVEQMLRKCLQSSPTEELKLIFPLQRFQGELGKKCLISARR